MSAGTVNSEHPLGGAPLAAEARLNCLNVTAPSGDTQTDFTVGHGAFQASSKVVSIIPLNAAALDVGQVGVTSCTGGILTLGFAEYTLLGTEVFQITVMSQV